MGGNRPGEKLAMSAKSIKKFKAACQSCRVANGRNDDREKKWSPKEST